MTRLQDLQPNSAVRAILPDALVTVVTVQWFGSEAIELTYKDSAGYAIHARHAADVSVTGVLDAVDPINLGLARVVQGASEQGSSEQRFRLMWGGRE